MPTGLVPSLLLLPGYESHDNPQIKRMTRPEYLNVYNLEIDHTDAIFCGTYLPHYAQAGNIDVIKIFQAHYI